MSPSLRSPRRLPAALRPLRVTLAASAAFLLALAPVPVEAASGKETGPALELRGQVLQMDGTPLPRARMTVRMSRAASVTCDDSGRFRTTLRLPTVAALERGAWVAQLDGSAKEFRLVYADGGPSLGLELTLDRGAAGTRVVARSNDERLASIAAAAVARAQAGSLDGVRFLALGGERASDPPAPNLTRTAAVVIESREPAAPVPAPAPPAPAPASSAPAITPAPVTPSPATTAPIAPSPEPKPAVSPRSSAARADSVRRAETARTDSLRRAETARADSVKAAKALADREAKAARTAATTGAAAGATTSKSSRRPKSSVSARDSLVATVRDSIPAPAPAPSRGNRPTPADASARGAATADRVRGVDPRPPIGPASPPVVPRSNTRAPEPPGPVVNPPRDEPLPDANTCQCRFDGTVEMVASALLERAERVVVRLEGTPAIADTVELYIGAPRSFRLEHVPCGSRRLRIDRLDPSLPAARIVTGQAMKGFGCASGELVQPRLVIALDRSRRR